MTLWPVIWVLVLWLVLVLCTPDDELVAVDFIVNVRPSICRPSSYADLRFFNFLLGSAKSTPLRVLSSEEVGRASKDVRLGGTGGGGPRSSDSSRVGRKSSSGARRPEACCMLRSRLSMRST